MPEKVVRGGGDWKWRAFGQVSSHIDENWKAGKPEDEEQQMAAIELMEGDALEKAKLRRQTQLTKK